MLSTLDMFLYLFPGTLDILAIWLLLLNNLPRSFPISKLFDRAMVLLLFLARQWFYSTLFGASARYASFVS